MHFNPRPDRAPRRSDPPRAAQPAARGAARTGAIPATILSHARSWASITFAGGRHRIELVFEGAEAVAAGELLSPSSPSTSSPCPASWSPTPR